MNKIIKTINVLKRVGSYVIRPFKLKRFIKWKLGPNGDTLFVSYPKCGRTWMKVMLDELNIPLHYTHGRGDWDMNHTSFKNMNLSVSDYRDNTVVLLVRNPIDVVVSSYFHLTKRRNAYDGSISEFIRDEYYGIKKVLRFYKTWEENLHVPRRVLVLKYEDLHKDTVRELNKLLLFLHERLEEEVTREELQRVVEYAKFDNMKERERKGKFKQKYGRILTPDSENEEESYKVRRGKVRGYDKYLMEEDVKYCKRWMKQFNHPFGY